ncbi:MAG: Flp family type IVb pilin [Pseudomonadota bacterium]
MCTSRLRSSLAEFAKDAAGATIVEYAVALIVVTIVGAVVLALGGNVAGIVDASAGAF